MADSERRAAAAEEKSSEEDHGADGDRWSDSAVKEERRRLCEQMSSEGSERAARLGFVRPDNEGRSTGKDVQSSLTVRGPSELRPASSVTIQLRWPPLSSRSLSGSV